MNCFSMIAPFSSFGLILCAAISLIQPTPKRKITVVCIYLSLLAPLMAYPAYMERYELPPSYLWLDGGMTIFFLLAPIWVYRQACLMLQTAEGMRQRSAKRAAYIDSLRLTEDEESA